MPIEIDEIASTIEVQPVPVEGSLTGIGITDELVRTIADLVYARLLLELKVERERCHWLSNSSTERKRAGHL